MKTISIKLSPQEIRTLIALYKDQEVSSKNEHVLKVFKLEGCVITLYKTGTVVFQGKEAEYHASIFSLKEVIKKEAPKIETRREDFEVQAGSDECGTGDFFGPVIVCACIVNKKNYEYFKTESIQDSKMITDEIIMELAPKLMKRLPYTILIVDNLKYNEVHQTRNLNKMKALLHNQAFINLKNKYGLPKLKIIDQFTPEASYYKYLKDEEIIIDTLHFETKAESKYFSVACASIIGRYHLIKAFQELQEKYGGFNFPKGSGVNVDQSGRLFVKKFGETELSKVSKIHFKNTTRILE